MRALTRDFAMAVTYRFPVLVWQSDGWFTASLVEWDQAAGFGRSATAALEQLEKHLAWLYRDDSFEGVPDLFDAALVQFKVSVRPEYQREGRRFPCDETVPLRVWCVHGRQEHGLRVAALPTLGLRFYYYDPESLRNLVAHYVQQSLEGVTPQALSRYLPPAAVTLE